MYQLCPFWRPPTWQTSARLGRQVFSDCIEQATTSAALLLVSRPIPVHSHTSRSLACLEATICIVLPRRPSGLGWAVAQELKRSRQEEEHARKEAQDMHEVFRADFKSTNEVQERMIAALYFSSRCLGPSCSWQGLEARLKAKPEKGAPAIPSFLRRGCSRR